MEQAMKDWRPQIDLDRLTAALGEDILALTDEEIRRAYAAAGRSAAYAAEGVREQIAIAGGDQDALNPKMLSPKEMREHARLVRQH
jgi:hypothetical protein